MIIIELYKCTLYTVSVQYMIFIDFYLINGQVHIVIIR